MQKHFVINSVKCLQQMQKNTAAKEIFVNVLWKFFVYNIYCVSSGAIFPKTKLIFNR